MLKYFRSSGRYFLKTFLYVIWAWIPAAVLPAFIGNPLGPLTFLFKYYELCSSPDFAGTPESVGKPYLTLIKGVFGNITWWTLPLFFLVILFFVSFHVGLIETHLKSGRFGYRKPFKRINDSITAVFPVVVFLFVCLTVFIFLDSGLILLLHTIISGTNNLPNAGDIAVVSILQVALYVFFVWIFAAATLFIPCSLILGYPTRGSAGYAVTLFRDIRKGYFTAAFLPLLFAFLPLSILTIYNVPDFVMIIVNTVFYALAGHYYNCLAFTAFYEHTGLERRDNLRGFHNN